MALAIAGKCFRPFICWRWAINEIGSMKYEKGNRNKENRKNGNKLTKILKKGIVISGLVARTLIGVGAAALLFLGVKKKKSK